MRSNILEQAMHAYCVELARPAGEKRKGVRTIAEEFGIPKQYKTILNHATGKTQPFSEYMASKQKILATEEHIIAKHAEKVEVRNQRKAIRVLRCGTVERDKGKTCASCEGLAGRVRAFECRGCAKERLAEETKTATKAKASTTAGS
jgi:hypothetical protein